MKRIFTKLTATVACLLIVLSQLVGCFNTETPPPSSNRPDVDEGKIPGYGQEAYAVVNGNIPYFEAEDITTESFEYYSELDALGRCGVAVASIGIDIMPTEDREGSLSVDPTGWRYNGKSNNNKYDFVDGGYVYNRCHLIGFQLTGENSNEKNLITGTRFLNIQGMLPFENMVADFIKESHEDGIEMHVMYRVTPIFDGNNFVARGVLMEGYSIEDEGEGICFCIFAYNVQPGVVINYYTGENSDDPNYVPNDGGDPANTTFVLNTSTKKYHLPTCTHAVNMKTENRFNYTGTPEGFLLLYSDYTPCGTCKPSESIPRATNYLIPAA